MNKFKVNNRFMDEGKTLDETINNFLITFLDEELNFYDIKNFDTILNN
jgi:hypothetical protein